MGGEYIPDRDDDEIEIARIEIRSTTSDVTSVYAQQVGTTIHYRVVDEYGGETLSGAAERESIASLTLGELEEFFTTAWPLIEVLESNFDADLESMLAFLKADSTLYPDLDALLRQRVIAAMSRVSDGPAPWSQIARPSPRGSGRGPPARGGDRHD
jgi:hypothetical protein